MDGIQGAILRVKLRRLERWTEMRRAHAARYDKELADSGVSTPVEMPWARHVYHAYTVRSPRRDALRDAHWRTAGSNRPSTTRSPCTCSRSSPISDLQPRRLPATRRLQRTRCCACRSSQSFRRMLPELVAACIREAHREA